MRRLVLLALLAPASPAFADCVGTTFLSCDVGRGRHLEVCIEPGARAFAYAFGPAGAPELTLREDFAAGTARPWNGVGRSIWASVGFRNAGHVYEAWHSLDRLDPEAVPEGGVNVLKGDAVLARLQCRPGPETVIAPIFSVEDAMQAAGFCRDREAESWRRDGCG